MSETMKSRIQRKLDELGLSARAASKLAGGSESLIRHVLTGASSNPRGDSLKKIAAVLHVSEQWLLTGDESAPAESPAPLAPLPNELRMADADPSLLRNLPRDVPVMGTVAGAEMGKGAFQLTADIVDYVRRPFGLIGAKDVYALYVEGTSMVPRFEPGDLVFVHPHRKPRGGDYVVIQEPDSNNGEPRGFIKRLVAFTAKTIRTEQFNPPTKIEFVNRPGTIVHKVMADGELYGV